MNEVEIKILDIDRKALETQLISLGAEKIFDGEMHAIYFDFQNQSLRKKNDLIRLRSEGKKSILTYKRFIADRRAKTRKEYEVEVSDFETMEDILDLLGLSQWLIMRKHRTSYKLGDAHFEFDKYFDDYGFIPEFLEIEGNDIESIYKFVDILGLRREDCRPWTILEVAEHYS